MIKQEKSKLECIEFKSMFGNLYSELKTSLKQQVMFYLVFIVRRLLFVVFTLFMRERNFFQIIAMNYLNLTMLIYNGYYKPFSSRFRNRVEVTNEVFITLATFHFMLFTDFTKDV